MRKFALFVLVLSGATFGLSVAFAQAPSPAGPPALDPPYKNLQVLPKDIGHDALINTMKSFTRSLGVRCTECHVGEEGKPLSTYDFVSDAKSHKRVARKMLAMVHRINREDFGVTDFKDVKVTCFTCHRGSTEPLTQAVPTPAPPPAAKPPAERG